MGAKKDKPHGSRRSQGRSERREKRAHAREQQYALAHRPDNQRAR